MHFDPVAFSLGPLSVHWYGITYLAAFAAFWLIQSWRAKALPWAGWATEQVSDFMFYGMLGVIAGGRLGYVLFYSMDSLAGDPLYLLRIWEGGMSFHGGMLGVVVASFVFARRNRKGFWETADFIVPVVPLGLAFGRLGNFIGGELWGRLSDLPWAMIFPASLPPGAVEGGLETAWRAGLLDAYARHPSQLYQAGLEGLLLFIILMVFASKRRPPGAVSGLFLVGYGLFRATAEFFREPDAHIGYLAGDWLTMGMVLSLPMTAVGLAFMVMAFRRPGTPGG
ncbi:prolipoprotein diacylglyceryl transferase [Marinihelvus fidelis]|uniref:Phosphatidylglycerol--prolipoprotein diacylglyceryl transferase n=1 Tax=Marinihelvus fidelis TaxID=2613842 RepID=A0A5N0T8W7_9GAMM|nr:prolipoprotein diacylglyceryl transferase [Marinihelvus fidelis]